MPDTPKKRPPVATIPAADLSGFDTETDRIIEVTLRIPFFGRRTQAEKFVTETLKRIVAIGIGYHVEIVDTKITTP